MEESNELKSDDYITAKRLKLIGNIVMIFFTFWALVFALGFEYMLPPHGPIWATFLIWIVSLSMGKFFAHMSIPALLGMLISGIILRNMPGELVDGLPDSWSAQYRALGLSLILMRSGLELDIPMVKLQGWIAARLTVCPGVCEAFVVAGMCMLIFHMHFPLALSCGFILAAVSPAVVVSGMFDLHKKGYGVAKGLPSLVVAAASFDDVVAISGFAMCIGVAIHSDENPILAALHGPINLLGGCFLGYVGGHIAGCTKIWNTNRKRLGIVLAIGLFYMFAAAKAHFNGGGAMAGLITGIFASLCWQKGSCGFLSSGPSKSYHHHVENGIAKIWDAFAQPLLFGVIGASVNFSELDAEVIPRAILCVGVATLVRVPVAIFVTGGKDFTIKERAFIGLSWIPKATVQAALGSAPLDLIREKMDSTDPDFEKWETWGKEILVTAVVSILITAPIGLICINSLGPKWLSRDSTAEKEDDYNALNQDIVTNLNEAWAINERNRREDENVVVLRKRTQIDRFFTTLKDHVAKVKSIINPEENVHGEIDNNDDKLMLLSEIEAINMSEGVPSEGKNGLSSDKLQKAIAQLLIVEEGIESLYNLLNRNAEVVPTSELFVTENGHYLDVPTQEEMMKRLHKILKDTTEGDDGQSTQHRRGSFNVLASHLGNVISKPKYLARSFSGYKASGTDVEMFKATHRPSDDNL